MRCSLSFYDINRWISVRIDTLGGIFAAAVSAYFVYASGITAGYAGFTLSLVLDLSRQVLFWVRIYNLLEIEGNSHFIDLRRTITLIWNTQIQRTGLLSKGSGDTKRADILDSLERVNQYLQIDHEPKPTDDGKPPAYWPASGGLRVENLCARYSDGMTTNVEFRSLAHLV